MRQRLFRGNLSTAWTEVQPARSKLISWLGSLPLPSPPEQTQCAETGGEVCDLALYAARVSRSNQAAKRCNLERRKTSSSASSLTRSWLNRVISRPSAI